MTALQPPICCMSCDEAPSIIRRKCCVFPFVKRALNGVIPPLWPDARILSMMMWASKRVSLSSIACPRSAAITLAASSCRSLVKSQRGDLERVEKVSMFLALDMGVY